MGCSNAEPREENQLEKGGKELRAHMTVSRKLNDFGTPEHG
jgi:hypothetical protein